MILLLMYSSCVKNSFRGNNTKMPSVGKLQRFITQFPEYVDLSRKPFIALNWKKQNKIMKNINKHFKIMDRVNGSVGKGACCKPNNVFNPYAHLCKLAPICTQTCTCTHTRAYKYITVVKYLIMRVMLQLFCNSLKLYLINKGKNKLLQ